MAVLRIRAVRDVLIPSQRKIGHITIDRRVTSYPNVDSVPNSKAFLILQQLQLLLGNGRLHLTESCEQGKNKPKYLCRSRYTTSCNCVSTRVLINFRTCYYTTPYGFLFFFFFSRIELISAPIPFIIRRPSSTKICSEAIVRGDVSQMKILT